MTTKKTATAAPKTKEKPLASLGEGKLSVKQLTTRWALAKSVAERANDEAEKVRNELEARGVKIGYQDENLIVAGSSKLEGAKSLRTLETAELVEILEGQGLLEESFARVPSVDRLEALAAAGNEKVGVILKKLTVPVARWEQARKKRPASA